MNNLFSRLRETITPSSFHTFPSFDEAESFLNESAAATAANGKPVNVWAAIIDRADPAAVLVLLAKREQLMMLAALVSAKWKDVESKALIEALEAKHATDLLLKIIYPITPKGADRPSTVH